MAFIPTTYAERFFSIRKNPTGFAKEPTLVALGNSRICRNLQPRATVYRYIIHAFFTNHRYGIFVLVVNAQRICYFPRFTVDHKSEKRLPSAVFHVYVQRFSIACVFYNNTAILPACHRNANLKVLRAYARKRMKGTIRFRYFTVACDRSVRKLQFGKGYFLCRVFAFRAHRNLCRYICKPIAHKRDRLFAFGKPYFVAIAGYGPRYARKRHLISFRVQSFRIAERTRDFIRHD